MRLQNYGTSYGKCNDSWNKNKDSGKYMNSNSNQVRFSARWENAMTTLAIQVESDATLTTQGDTTTPPIDLFPPHS